GDEIYMADNYDDEMPLGAGLLWSHRHWFRSLKLLKELERRHDAEVVYGHDPDQFPEIDGGWGQGATTAVCRHPGTGSHLRRSGTSKCPRSGSVEEPFRNSDISSTTSGSKTEATDSWSPIKISPTSAIPNASART